MADMMKLNGVFDKIRNAGALPKWYTAQPFTDIDRILKNNPALSPALRWSDALTPAVLLASQRSLTADLTAVLSGPSALTGWRAALASQTKLAGISDMLAAAGVNQRIGLFANIETARALSAIATRNLDALAPWADIATKLNTPPLAAAPLSAYRRYLDRSDEDLTDHRLAMGAVSSFAIGGATAAQVLLADDGDANDDALVLVTDVSEQVEDELIAPWRAGQLDAAQDLRDRLGVFDATVPEMLDGAWLDIARPGPAQLVKVSACAVEAIDRALRAVAPDDDVEAWVAATGLKPSRTLVIYSDRGTLTRQVRIRYATRARTADRRLIETQEKSLSALAAELTSRFNAGKHASQGGLVHARTLLMTAEALLSQLVLPND